MEAFLKLKGWLLMWNLEYNNGVRKVGICNIYWPTAKAVEYEYQKYILSFSVLGQLFNKEAG